MKCKYYLSLKRTIDILLALSALLLLLIPMLIISLIIFLEDRQSVLFCQKRIGLDGKAFMIYKFRTMSKDAPAYLSCDQMSREKCFVTRIGHLLRRTSLDELPQLFNVLKGDMSLIGPRPLIPEEREIHQARLEKGVYKLRPGLTGIAQINGRNGISDMEKVEYDYCYLSNISLRTDMTILFSTIPLVCSGKGIMDHKCKHESLEMRNDTCLGKAM